MKFELSGRANVEKRYPYDRRLGETSTAERDYRWNGVIFSSKCRDEQRHSIGRPGKDEAARRDDNT